MDVKTFSAMLGHMSAVTTLDIYTHITDDMQCAVASIDRGNRQGRTAGRSGAGAERHRGLPALRGEEKETRHRLCQRTQ